ncbi:hypothetical protein KFE25_008200 [Diacronema lutheri]|uniref:Uncharacterized protein n=1 Tax=Diacronema lutheri TaxID=2081491 RepID=A0A8J6CD72_DIALT|nr:hypothetical protein KFE25_008200 [Diacronema lutheri]
MEPTSCVPIGATGDYFLELDCDKSGAGGLIALADTSFRMYLYDCTTLRLVAHAAHAHADRIRCVRHARLGSAAAVLSASDDGRVRAWDPRQGLSYPALELSARPDGALAEPDDADGAGLFATDADASGTLVCAGGEARVLLWDVRMAAARAGALHTYDEVHTEACTSARFHAGQPSRLVTGSVDGLLCLLDGTKDGGDDELVRAVCNAGDAVVRAGAFDGWGAGPADDGLHAYCVSGTEVVSVWALESGVRRASWERICAPGGSSATVEADALDGDDADDAFAGAAAARADPGALDDGDGAGVARGAAYVVDCLVAGAGARAPAGAAPTPAASSLGVVAGTHAGEVHVLALPHAAGSQPAPCVVLRAGGAARAGHRLTVRACAWAEEAGQLFTIGEDGLLCCWRAERLLDARANAHAARLEEAADAAKTNEDASRRAGNGRAARAGHVRVSSRDGLETARRAVARARPHGVAARRAKAASALLATFDPAYVRWVAVTRAAARVHWLARVRACHFRRSSDE